MGLALSGPWLVLDLSEGRLSKFGCFSKHHVSVSSEFASNRLSGESPPPLLW